MSILPIPPRSLILLNKKPKPNKVFTIHNYKHNPFMLKHEVKEDLNTTVISFKREEDALQFAQLIELHKLITKHYPTTTLEGMTSLFINTKLLNENYIPNELYLKSWDYDDLRIYCGTHLLNLFVMQSMILKDNNVYNLKGQHIILSIPIEKYIEILEEIYNRPKEVKDLDDEW
jgi:hypothetical protein